MLKLATETDHVRFGERFTLRFERTIRVPDDGRTYPLPPGLGRFEIHRVDEYRDRVPPQWRDRGGVFIAMYQAEALWLSFDAAPWKPSAVTVGVGRINALTGGPWPGTLDASPQNYVVCPPQLWLDGINAGHEFVRQFVAMPLGRGATVEGQITGTEAHGGLQVRVFDPKPGRFPDEGPASRRGLGRPPWMASSSGATMGFVPGGQIDQKVLADPYGVETWDVRQLRHADRARAEQRAIRSRDRPACAALSGQRAHLCRTRLPVVPPLRGGVRYPTGRCAGRAHLDRRAERAGRSRVRGGGPVRCHRVVETEYIPSIV